MDFNRDKLIKYIKNSKKKRLKTLVLEDVYKKGYEKIYFKKNGYPLFCKTINSLEQEDILEPIKSWKLNGRHPSLYNGYRKLKPKSEMTSAEKSEILNFYHPKIKTSYYFDNIKEYRKDKAYLKAIDKFLKDKNILEIITVNERSYDIIGDEKFLLTNYGRKLLNKVKLNFKDLKCYETYEPFFYYSTSTNEKEINAIIIENKDTFYSLKKLLQSNNNTWNNIKFDLLIYGEGKKILKSFSFFEEIENFKDKKVKFYYYGDIDPVGIEIWHNLNEKYKYEIDPFGYFYDKLLELNYNKSKKIKKDQKLKQKSLEVFSKYIKQKQKLMGIINDGKYIPQEGLNYNFLKELGDKDGR